MPSVLLLGSIPAVAEGLEVRYDYVARTWVDLALFYKDVNRERLEILIENLRCEQ